jgi:hypothetical protein
MPLARIGVRGSGPVHLLRARRRSVQTWFSRPCLIDYCAMPPSDLPVMLGLDLGRIDRMAVDGGTPRGGEETLQELIRLSWIEV